MTHIKTTTAADKLLRELTEDEFTAIYHCDRFVASVLASRFRYIIDNITTQLFNYAFSPIVREVADMSATLCGPPSIGFATPAVSSTMPIFFASMSDAVRIALEEYGIDQVVPGDVIVVNDPYRAGNHVNDVCFIRPVFDGPAIVGVVTIRAHMLDFGGQAKGGFDVTKENLYVDGLVLPPSLLYHAGKPVKSMFSLILDNTRFGPIVIPDIRTINTSLQLGDRLLLETVRKYGLDAYLGGIRYACDVSAESMGTALERLPDGIYEGEEFLDTDGTAAAGTLPITRVHINKRGRRAEFDLSGSSPANMSALNCPGLSAKSAIALALKFLIDPRTPFTSGTLRNVDVVLPPDSYINSSPPYSTGLYFEVTETITNATFCALNSALGDDAIASDSGNTSIHFAHGSFPDGTPWFCAPVPVPAISPWSANRHGDGDSAQIPKYANVYYSGIEQYEAEGPVLFMRTDYVPDTAGPGFYRGGAAGVIDSFWTAPAEHRLQAFHVRPQAKSRGVNGGSSGTFGACWMWVSATSQVATPSFVPLNLSSPIYRDAVPMLGVLDTQSQELSPRGTYHFKRDLVSASANTMFRLVPNGGAGWGDPLERDPKRVCNDVRDEYVSIAGAARDYGVVVVGDPAKDPEGLRIDQQATERLRAERRSSTKGI